MVAEPGEVHAPAPDHGAFDVDVIGVDVQIVSNFASDEAKAWHSGFSIKKPPSINRELRQSFCAFTRVLRNVAAPRLLVEERLIAFLADLRLAYAPGDVPPQDHSTDRDAVHRALEMLHDLCVTPVTLDSLANVSGLPKPRFLRSFRRITGLPPHAYQVQLRVNRARRLIVEGAEISAAAVSAGFSDQSHLNRHFTRLVGMPPGAYARSVRRSARAEVR